MLKSILVLHCQKLRAKLASRIPVWIDRNNLYVIITIPFLFKKKIVVENWEISFRTLLRTAELSKRHLELMVKIRVLVCFNMLFSYWFVSVIKINCRVLVSWGFSRLGPPWPSLMTKTLGNLKFWSYINYLSQNK